MCNGMKFAKETIRLRENLLMKDLYDNIRAI